MRHLRIVILVAVLAAGTSGQTPDGAAPLPDRPLIVATRHVPPFAIRASDGSWSGISIDLWTEVADELALRYEFRDMPLPRMLAGLGDGSVDVAVAALTVTPERESAFDFTHAFHTTGIGVAVVSEQSAGWLGAAKRFLSWGFLQIVLSLAALLLVVGAVVWLFERRQNPEQFGGSWLKGVASGFWWSAVTMTTVGYGDKAPKTVVGRLLAMIWMFAAIILISTFTATIAASLTVSELGTPSHTVKDLPGIRVATVSGSTGADYLRNQRIAFGKYAGATEALRAAADGRIDAVVYDAPILRYLVQERYQGRLTVLAQRLERQDYAFGLPDGSPLREPLNRAMLEHIRQPHWQDVLFEYLGEQ